jgi:hypothetical protein
MPHTKLILVEGIPGTGKSTVAQFVNLHLNACGRPSSWCHEEHVAHPLRLFYAPERHLSCSDYSDEAVVRWQSYVAELHRKDQIAVLDAAFLQNHIRSMLIFDCDRDEMFRLAGRIESLIASLDPILIYLKPKDVERNFRDVVEVRGQRMLELWIEAHDQYPYARKAQAEGYPGFIAFWKEFAEISDRVIDELTISKLRQNVSSDNWDARLGEILDFLDLPVPADFTSSQDLERFTGRYALEGDTASEFVLQTRGGCLVASVDQPTFDVHRGPIGCFREVRLFPKGESQYYVAAWPHTVKFTESKTGAIVDMRLSVHEDGWADLSTVFVKQL